jgi:hypothetical protein
MITRFRKANARQPQVAGKVDNSGDCSYAKYITACDPDQPTPPPFKEESVRCSGNYPCINGRQKEYWMHYCNNPCFLLNNLACCEIAKKEITIKEPLFKSS